MNCENPYKQHVTETKSTYYIRYLASMFSWHLVVVVDSTIKHNYTHTLNNESNKIHFEITLSDSSYFLERLSRTLIIVVSSFEKERVKNIKKILVKFLFRNDFFYWKTTWSIVRILVAWKASVVFVLFNDNENNM